jgi:hypothetical protein
VRLHDTTDRKLDDADGLSGNLQSREGVGVGGDVEILAFIASIVSILKGGGGLDQPAIRE